MCSFMLNLTFSFMIFLPLLPLRVIHSTFLSCPFWMPFGKPPIDADFIHLLWMDMGYT